MKSRWKSSRRRWPRSASSRWARGDRSEKIRTYNFPQNRLTDHRIGLTNHQLAEIMEGRLQPTIDALIAHYQAERLKAETAHPRNSHRDRRDYLWCKFA